MTETDGIGVSGIKEGVINGYKSNKKRVKQIDVKAKSKQSSKTLRS